VLFVGTKHKLKRRVEQTILPSQIVESTRLGSVRSLYVCVHVIVALLYRKCDFFFQSYAN